MGRNRNRRVEKVNHGYGEKKRSVWVPRENEALERVVGQRVGRGYRKGWKKGRKGRTVELGYTRKGTAVIQERKVIGKPSRPRRVKHTERWAMKGDRGIFRRDTTDGRKTGEEAMKEELGGSRRLWVC
jgi:ribosomal protein S8